MNLFASRPRSDARGGAPHRILVRRTLVFALLVGLTSGLRVTPDNVHATFTQGVNSILLHGPAIDWPFLGPIGLASAATTRQLTVGFSDSEPLIDGNPEN